ncbi:uncharacterized protein VICG_00747 [Vittaforma corneae ATCC 50505]|uniref:Piwi domain-containing protein n=1 Tax=Vittaforma corneae (strain ATCC 50505) TaxID=993615 RepID=L2GMR6_VITCO|nr:uncharacterized protein VICG_00747 [Vittaforma corneae ATCC 50505]ELA42106.1 hypothetical protein VICG_00747 [Vittaforma corneae ATCC 50505]
MALVETRDQETTGLKEVMLDRKDDYGNRYRGDYGDHPARPSVSTITEPTSCQVSVNLFKYTGKSLVLHHYAVTFTPEILKKNIFSKFLQMAESNNFKEPYAFDGGNLLVSTKKFADVTFRIPMREEELLCKIEYKHTYDTGDMSGDVAAALQCMEIISRFYQKINHCVDKTKMFYLGSRPFDLGCGLEIIPGLSSSIRLSRGGVYLNIDATFGVFYRAIPLIDLFVDLARSRDKRERRHVLDPLRDDMGASFYYDFERLIKNLQVVTTHRERNFSFKVSGLLVQPASSVEFEADGKTWTVAEYFAKTYKPLRYPHLPLAVIKKRTLLIYLPLEILKICPSQKYTQKLDEGMTAQMIKIAAERPGKRFEMIREKAAELAVLKNSILTQFGMAFDNKMLNCKGIILPPPQITFSDSKKVNVNNGGWNLIGARAIDGCRIDEWKIFSFTSTSIIRDSTIDSFISLASRYGVNISPRPQSVVVRDINEFFDASKAKFNLVVLPDKNSQRYEEVKRIAETYQGVYTQCMVASNIPKLNNPSFVSNLLLKINAKLGGKNWAIDKKILQDKPTILVGIDVCHPGAADLESPSIASVVATMDYNFIGYKTIIEQQERRQEIVRTLKDNIKVMLKSHYASTSTKPARILVFRDGVGDSMFNAVYSCEIEAIEDACKDLDASYKPEINFIIAQKRHSIRFQTGNGNNLVPGTIVDEIGSPGIFDFYLVSHHALQGTARPVRYVLIRNDSKFTGSEMYALIYNLCHLYARATKSVSVVPPIYYADLAAARGKCYLEKNKDGILVMRNCDKQIQKSLYYL